MWPPSTTESLEPRPLRQMRNFTTVTVITTYVVGLFAALRNLDTVWLHLLVLGPSLLAAGWVMFRWYDPPGRRLLIPLLLVCEASFVCGALLGLHPLSVLGLALAASIHVCSLPSRERLRPIVMLLLVVAATACLYFVSTPAVAWRMVVSSLIFAGATLLAFWVNDLSWRLFTELDSMRRTETELAVMKERFRFASDLHDIQGHTLHVIRLKAAVAARLQHSDPDRTATELADISRLTAETIEQARELANSTNTLSFESELANAENLFRDAGMTVTTSKQPVSNPAASRLMALVLREATTNILRHSQATRVDISVSPAGLEIANNGGSNPNPTLRGLAALRIRAAEAGAKLSIENGSDLFVLRLELPGGAA